MKVTDINDHNCLVEVYLHYLIKHCEFEADKIGFLKSDNNFGIYHIWDIHSDRFMVLLTDDNLYNDKRAKKKLTKEKRSFIFMFPEEEEHSIMTEDNLNRVMHFFSGEPTDMKMYETKNMDFVVSYLSSK